MHDIAILHARLWENTRGPTNEALALAANTRGLTKSHDHELLQQTLDETFAADLVGGSRGQALSPGRWLAQAPSSSLSDLALVLDLVLGLLLLLQEALLQELAKEELLMLAMWRDLRPKPSPGSRLPQGPLLGAST